MGDFLESLGLGTEVRELKLGESFTDDRSGFHTLKYDFKPASVDESKMVTLDVGSNNTMTVTVPNLDGTTKTVFKGSEKLCQKECILIIDHVTGEIILERLSSNIQVKKTRNENGNSNSTPVTPNELKSSPESSKGSPESKTWSTEYTQSKKSPLEEDVTSPANSRSNSRTKVVSGKKKKPTFELPGKKIPGRFSPYLSNKKSISPTNISNSPPLAQMPGSLPVIGMEDDFSLSPMSDAAPPISQNLLPVPPKSSPISIQEVHTFKITEETSRCSLSDTSSSSSSSSSGSSDTSDNESDNETEPVLPKPNNELPIMPNNLLNDDLKLSETESESD